MYEMTVGENAHDKVLAIVRSLVAKLLQYDESEVEMDVPLLEMGADSMVFVDAVRRLEDAFSVSIPVRRLFDDLSTLNALVAFIASNMPADWGSMEKAEVESPPSHSKENGVVVTPTVTHIPAAPNGGPPQPLSTYVNGSKLNTNQAKGVLTHIISQQLEVLNRQLGLLEGRVVEAAPEPEALAAEPAAPRAKPEASKPAAKGVLPFAQGVDLSRQGYSAEQQAHLERLIQAHNQRTRNSKEKTQRYRAVLADNRASAGFRLSTKELLYPIIAQRAQGSRMWDIDDNEYIDIAMGFGVYLFGHNPTFVRQAVEEQLGMGMQLGPQSELAGEVAALISELTGVERVAFLNSGTEAVMTALRLARTATRRPKYAMFLGSYHGHFDGTLATPSLEDDSQAIPLTAGVSAQMVKDCLLLPYGEERAFEILERHAGDLAAVIVEPVQSRRPELQPRAFLQRLRAFTAQAGIALIFDEMITGFRLHQGGAQAWYGLEADLVTYGKVVGGGMPIGVVAGKGAFMDCLDGGMWQYGDASYPATETTFFAGTFCKHPLTMAATRAVLRHLKAEGPALQASLNARTTQFTEALNAYFVADEVPMEMVHFGSLYRFQYKGNGDLLFYHLLQNGVYTWEGRTCFVTTAHSDEDLEAVIAAVKKSVSQLRAGGFLPQNTAVPELTAQK